MSTQRGGAPGLSVVAADVRDQPGAFGCHGHQLGERVRGVRSVQAEPGFLGEVAGHECDQAFGKHDGGLVHERGQGCKRSFAHLLDDRFQHAWMAVAGVGDGPSSHKIEILLAVNISNGASFGALDCQRIEANFEHVAQCAGIASGQRVCPGGSLRRPCLPRANDREAAGSLCGVASPAVAGRAMPGRG